MVERSTERIRIWHPDGHEHQLTVMFVSGSFEAVIGAVYEGGFAAIDPGTQVARWTAIYEPPNEFDSGQVYFGNGRIDLEIEILRGIGTGSLLMLPLVRWAKSQPSNVPVAPISLAGQDAGTDDDRERRNRFYEKLGFVFDYEDNERTYGSARKMLVSELFMPEFKMSKGWRVESFSPTSSVFKTD